MEELVDGRGRPRIVITGMGAVTPVGNSAEESWQNAIEGNSGIGPITLFDASDLPCRIAGEVKDFNPKDFMNVKEARRMSRSSQFAVAAAKMALADARLPEKVPEPERRAGLSAWRVLDFGSTEGVVLAFVGLRPQDRGRVSSQPDQPQPSR